MRRVLTITVTVVVAAAALVATSAPLAAQTGPTVERDVVYRKVDGERLKADIFLPAASGTDRPAVLVVHGGGWTEGDKEQDAWAGYGLAQLGYVAVTVNYRLAPEYEYPAAIEDLEAAVRWLRKPRQRDGYGIDPTRIAAAGGSAGGYLVGLLATAGSGPLDRGSRIAAAVSWSGPMDLTAEAARVDSGEQRAGDRVAAFLGCTFEHCPEAWARAASPVTYVDASDPPMLFTHAMFDLISLATVEPMLDALADAGVEHDLVIAPGTGHSSSLAPDVADDTVQFLDAHLQETEPAP